MDLENLVPGQRDWVNTINGNFQKLNVKGEIYHSGDLVLLNGWTKRHDDDTSLWLQTYPLLDGSKLKYLTFDLQGTTSPGRMDKVIQVPQDAATSHANVLESNMTVTANDDIGTPFDLVIDASFDNSTTLRFNMKAVYGVAPRELSNAHVYGAVAWI